MTPVIDAPTKAHPARQKAIQPYLDKLQGWCSSPAGSQDLDRGAKIGIGSQQLELDPWERGLLLQYVRGSQEELPGLLAHGIALVIKSTLDVERLKRHDTNVSTEIYALQAELMLDTAIGMALLHEADLAIGTEVQGGSNDTAKSLSMFRHKLARAVSEAKKRIADSERRQAETLAGSMTDRPFSVEGAVDAASVEGAKGPTGPVGAAIATAPDPAIQTLIEEATAATETMPRRRRRPRRRPASASPTSAAPKATPAPSRSKLLALAVGALAAAWLVTVQVPTWVRSDLTLIDASHIGGTADLAVVARPPSLFVTVPAAQWEAMNPGEQEELIDSISAVASREGYFGARLKTDAGKPVARWLRSRGSERVPDGEGGPSTPSE